MLKKILVNNMGKSNLGWLESRFHFSFADYINYDNVHFGVLRVLNDDVVHAQSGFDTHSHNDMEIISYIVRGEITHKDSMGHSETLTKGEVQYLSAGTGITHSEHNTNKSEDLRLLQIWIYPPKKNLTPLYGSIKYEKEESQNKILNIVSSQSGDAKIKIYQDVNIYVSQIDKNNNHEFIIEKNRQVYFVQIEGTSLVNGIELNDGDAMEIVKENTLKINAVSDSHVLFIEMKEEK
jgi:redox-sensitive bicupin YhaK (pirin superfamily)